VTVVNHHPGVWVVTEEPEVASQRGTGKQKRNHQNTAAEPCNNTEENESPCALTEKYGHRGHTGKKIRGKPGHQWNIGEEIGET